jgi:hypothetical protein
MVCGSSPAPFSVFRFAVKVPTRVPSAWNAAEPMLSMEQGPGIGPSASMSVLT